MSVHVWSDNETAQDRIGFRVHADLIRNVVTNERMLPVVLGVFGDWGGGKSSVMRMLQQDLEGVQYERAACLYFNGWMFEGYEDAKTALLSSILVQLGEHKRFGPALRDKVAGLLKRVNWMGVTKLGLKHGLPIAAAYFAGGDSAALAAFGAQFAKPGAAGPSGKPEEKQHKGQDLWSDLIRNAPTSPDILEVRKFRDEFSEMLAETDIHSLVILIDDLDRCLPERIIETLEAIKLFMAVEKTAFVIGADPRIVRHAIATRYVKERIAVDELSTPEEQYSLVNDYLEKLIQIPYHLPRLSPSEVESYINLLACERVLDGAAYSKVVGHWQSCRTKNLYAAFRHSNVCEALGSADAAPAALLRQLGWSNAIADVLTEGLKGNPRQVKRMLNAMALRSQLADVAGIKVRDDVLAKLMVLEYANLPLFQQLNQWQAATGGFPEQLKQLEVAAIDQGDSGALAEAAFKDWSVSKVQNWLRMQPRLSDVDLRDYFWLARDRTHSTLSGVSMVAPIVRRLFESLVSENKGEQKAAAKEALPLSAGERSELLAMLRRHIERHPSEGTALDALLNLAEQKLAGAADTFIAALKGSVRSQLAAGTAYRLKTLANVPGDHQQQAQALLEQLSQDTSTPVGKAAARNLKPKQQ
jgi:hypothetical protein